MVAFNGSYMGSLLGSLNTPNKSPLCHSKPVTLEKQRKKEKKQGKKVDFKKNLIPNNSKSGIYLLINRNGKIFLKFSKNYYSLITKKEVYRG